jgi:eukaryotic-like serine/threonine-protein kinase
MSDTGVFKVVVKLPAEQRAAYLDQACGSNQELRQEVESLLRAHEESQSFLERPAVHVEPAERLIAERPGTIIGPYTLLEQIGEGGMGVVFLAEQTHPIERQVALKIVKPGLDSRQVLARFEAERHALALMDHPNIAKVLDAGTTASGRPYFVMELVKGVPITQYCDDRQLSPRQRLDLFVPVCHAVQHAHQKGIIHRDLKPSNVLVAEYDDRPVPKIIDFGVAKAIGSKLNDRTLFTEFGQIIGTLEYMSPEQAKLNALDIDTRSDIYALGVLLYELLTGTTPFDKNRLKQSAFDEVLRIIREEEPPKPSTRISTTDAAPSIAANRSTEPKKLSGLIRGELDWVVMKALEKDRTRRYGTASGLARDIERYLQDEPVEACPPSSWYRFRKFSRRNKGRLIAAVAFVLLLVTTVVTLTIALIAVNRERREKEAALDAAVRRQKQTREALDAMTSKIIGDWLSMQKTLLPEQKQFLEGALRSYEEFAADTGQQEESRAAVAQAYVRVGTIRVRLGQRKDAEAAWERGRELYAGLIGDFPAVPAYRQGLAEIHLYRGMLYSAAGRPREAEEAYGRALAVLRQLVADLPDVPGYRKDLAFTLNNLGILLGNTGRAPQAEEVYREALAILKQLAADFPTEPSYRYALGGTHLALALLLDRTPGRQREGGLNRPGPLREAAKNLEQAVAIFKQLAADIPSMHDYRDALARSQNHLGSILRDTGRRTEAEEAFRQTLAVRKQLVADLPMMPVYRQGLAITLNDLGILLKNSDRSEQAEEVYREALGVFKRLAADFPEPDHQAQVAGAMVNLARLLQVRTDFEASRRLLVEAEPYHQATLKASPLHPDYRRFYRNNRWRLAETLLELKDHAAAAVAAQEFLQAAVEPPRDAYTAAVLLAGCVRLAAQDERLPERRRQELAATYGDRAVAALRQAVDRRAKEVTQIQTDPSLDPLRLRADFQQLLEELKAKRQEPEIKGAGLPK